MTITSLPSALRSWETYVWSTFAALAGGRLGPEVFDQPIAPDGLAQVQEQDRQERLLLGRVERDDATFGYRFERPEYAEVHSEAPVRD